MAAASASLESATRGAKSSAALEFLKSSPKKLLINGKWVPSKSGKTFETLNPSNFPLLMASWKIAPALACGNVVILKPAEQTPLTALRLGELILEAGLPEGVVQIITGFGPGAGSAIAEHPDIDKVAFTGSTEVGKLILQASTGNLKRVSLELGGKSPNIIFPDADMPSAVFGSALGIFMNQGQVCCAGSRVFVQEKVYDQFTDELSKIASGLTLGNPLDPKPRMGPLVSKEQHDRVKG